MGKSQKEYTLELIITERKMTMRLFFSNLLFTPPSDATVNVAGNSLTLTNIGKVTLWFIGTQQTTESIRHVPLNASRWLICSNTDDYSLYF